MRRRAGGGYAFPASFAQERLWILDQLEADGSVYNMPAAVHLAGELDVEALDRALNEIVSRHEALRTIFRYADEQLVQVVLPGMRVGLPVEPVAGGLSAARQLAAVEAQRPFDLAEGPLLRARLLRLGEREHVLLVTMHHIVSDGWSLGVLVGELGVLYAAFRDGKPSPLAPLPLQYPDVAVWQRRRLSDPDPAEAEGGDGGGRVLAEQLGYWRLRLGNSAPVLGLPADRPRPPVQTYRGADCSIVLPAALLGQLEGLGQRADASLFMVLLAGLQALLGRYSGQDDVVVGTFIANRTRPELEALIGFFVNTLALRTDLSGDPSVVDLLGRVRETCVGAYAHQEIPFERLLAELQPERDLSRTPLFQAMLVLQNTPEVEFELPGLVCRVLPVPTRRSNFDLTLWAAPQAEPAGGLELRVEYATDLFDQATIQRLLGHYQTLLAGMVADPEQRLLRLPLLSESERRQVLVDWNATTRDDATAGLCLQQLFEQQVAQTPEAAALLAGDGREQLTYRQLNARANQLAWHLRELGVGPDAVVGVCLERSIDAVVAILGVLKAGGAYLPLDPTHPTQRLAFLLADTRARVLLTRQGLQQALPATQPEGDGDGPGPQLVLLDADWPAVARHPDHNPPTHPDTSPANLAYVIYTSGSTGTPKGVMIQHDSIVNYADFAADEFVLGPGDRVLQFHALTVDTSVEELFPCLARGATLVIRPESMIDSTTAFVRACSELELTVLDLPTGYWHELTAGFDREDVTLPPSVRLTIIAGEKALPDRLARWQKHVGERVRLVNTYGPTEATIVATSCDLPAACWTPDQPGELPIGRPVRNVQAYVLDRHMNPVPVGVHGELHVGGVSLARGYIRCPALTAERFVPNPFSNQPGARLYKTGDTVRLLADGSIECLGRADDQVKIRGFRIEPGEIENVIARHPAVQDAVVVAHSRTLTDRRLCAYVVAEAGARTPTVPELRAFLGQQLPGYMIPSAFVTLDSLPRTPPGKVDRAALPELDGSRPDLGNEFVAPRSRIEAVLTGIWSELLGVERVGVYDDFFELGGHSMLGVQLLFRVRKALDVELPLFSVFQAPTVAGLAEIVARRISEQKGECVMDPDEVLARIEELPQEEVDSLLRTLSTGEQGGIR